MSSIRASVPIGICGELIEALQLAGMAHYDVDARQVSSILSAVSAGLALTTPHDGLVLMNNRLMTSARAEP